MGAVRKPMLYLTWDKTGMFIWLGKRPERHGGIYRQIETGGREVKNPVRLRLPVSWFGGLVDEGGCRECDPEDAFGFPCV